MAEAADTQQRRTPIGDDAEVVDEPAQRRLRLREGTRGHHQSAEGNLAGEVQRRRHQNGRDDGDPAETRRDPGQFGEAADQPPGGGQHIAEMLLDAPLFVRLTFGQRNAVDMFVDPNQGKPQVCFTRIALRVAVDEAASHPIAEDRTGARIRNGRPEHEARNAVVDFTNPKHKISRQHPQNAGERPKQNGRLQ